MTHEEAIALCRRYASEHPDRNVAQWRPKETGDGEWTVARIGLAPRGETTPTVEAAERPQTADDPRAAIFQNIPPSGAGF